MVTIMRCSRIVFGSCAFLPLLVVSGVAAQGGDADRRGLDIAQAADRANQGFGSERATLSMDLVNAHGDVSKRKVAIETLEGTSDGDRSRVIFEWPPDVKGTKLLTWTHKQREDDQWLYLPAIKRTRRISGSNKTGSFMGSELAYEDLASAEVERFGYRYIDEPTLNGRATFHIERTPRDPNSGYSREVVWLDKEYQNPLRIDFYDRKQALLKTATFAGYRRFDRFWRPASITFENLQTKKKTILTFDNRQLGVKLAPQTFDSARLED
jgi:outer membrane lipoprotein-sorting protein